MLVPFVNGSYPYRGATCLLELLAARNPAFYSRRRLEDGACFIEHPAADSPVYADRLVGRSAFLLGYAMRACFGADQLAGWIEELNDHEQAVISLRTAAGRGH